MVQRTLPLRSSREYPARISSSPSPSRSSGSGWWAVWKPPGSETRQSRFHEASWAQNAMVPVLDEEVRGRARGGKTCKDDAVGHAEVIGETKAPQDPTVLPRKDEDLPGDAREDLGLAVAVVVPDLERHIVEADVGARSALPPAPEDRAVELHRSHRGHDLLVVPARDEVHVTIAVQVAGNEVLAAPAFGQLHHLPGLDERRRPSVFRLTGQIHVEGSRSEPSRHDPGADQKGAHASSSSAGSAGERPLASTRSSPSSWRSRTMTSAASGRASASAFVVSPLRTSTARAPLARAIAMSV